VECVDRPQRGLVSRREIALGPVVADAIDQFFGEPLVPRTGETDRLADGAVDASRIASQSAGISVPTICPTRIRHSSSKVGSTSRFCQNSAAKSRHAAKRSGRRPKARSMGVAPVADSGSHVI
jgi:hypothetical protein